MKLATAVSGGKLAIIRVLTDSDEAAREAMRYVMETDMEYCVVATLAPGCYRIKVSPDDRKCTHDFGLHYNGTDVRGTLMEEGWISVKYVRALDEPEVVRLFKLFHGDQWEEFEQEVLDGAHEYVNMESGESSGSAQNWAELALETGIMPYPESMRVPEGCAPELAVLFRQLRQDWRQAGAVFYGRMPTHDWRCFATDGDGDGSLLLTPELNEYMDSVTSLALGAGYVAEAVGSYELRGTTSMHRLRLRKP